MELPYLTQHAEIGSYFVSVPSVADGIPTRGVGTRKGRPEDRIPTPTTRSTRALAHISKKILTSLDFYATGAPFLQIICETGLPRVYRGLPGSHQPQRLQPW